MPETEALKGAGVHFTGQTDPVRVALPAIQMLIGVGYGRRLTS